jgi:hypothetical protein
MKPLGIFDEVVAHNVFRQRAAGDLHGRRPTSDLHRKGRASPYEDTSPNAAGLAAEGPAQLQLGVSQRKMNNRGFVQV